MPDLYVVLKISQASAQQAGSKPFSAFIVGDRVRKKSGSNWHGHVVGFYSTELTPIGYCIESEREPGSVQIYPEAALERVANEN